MPNLMHEGFMWSWHFEVLTSVNTQHPGSLFQKKKNNNLTHFTSCTVKVLLFNGIDPLVIESFLCQFSHPNLFTTETVMATQPSKVLLNVHFWASKSASIDEATCVSHVNRVIKLMAATEPWKSSLLHFHGTQVLLFSSNRWTDRQ